MGWSDAMTEGGLMPGCRAHRNGGWGPIEQLLGQGLRPGLRPPTAARHRCPRRMCPRAPERPEGPSAETFGIAGVVGHPPRPRSKGRAACTAVDPPGAICPAASDHGDVFASQATHIAAANWLSGGYSCNREQPVEPLRGLDGPVAVVSLTVGC